MIEFFESIREEREKFLENIKGSLKIEPIKFEKIVPESKIEAGKYFPTPPKREVTVGETYPVPPKEPIKAGEAYPYVSKEQIEAGEMFPSPREVAERRAIEKPIEKIFGKEEAEKIGEMAKIMARGGERILEAFREYLRKKEEERKKERELLEALPKEEKIKVAMERARIPIIEKKVHPELEIPVV